MLPSISVKIPVRIKPDAKKRAEYTLTCKARGDTFGVTHRRSAARPGRTLLSCSLYPALSSQKPFSAASGCSSASPGLVVERRVFSLSLGAFPCPQVQVVARVCSRPANLVRQPLSQPQWCRWHRQRSLTSIPGHGHLPQHQTSAIEMGTKLFTFEST